METVQEQWGRVGGYPETGGRVDGFFSVLPTKALTKTCKLKKTKKHSNSRFNLSFFTPDLPLSTYMFFFFLSVVADVNT